MASRRLPPLMRQNPLPMQVLLVVVVPVAFGAVTGIFLGLSEPVYIVLSIIGVVGGVGAGFDHLGAREGALRGLVAGALFGASILTRMSCTAGRRRRICPTRRSCSCW